MLVTHTDTDPFNPDHPVAYEVVARARTLAAGAAWRARSSDPPPELFLFEPHQPELCNFTPTTFVDITPVIRGEARGDGRDGGAAVPADLLRPARRAARQPRAARSGDPEVRYAEAFQRVLPQVVAAL